MKKWYCLSFITIIAAFVLEVLPYGAVLNFGSPDGTVKRATYSYFNMITFGYANFGPIPTALFSTVILIGVAVLLVYKKPAPKLNSAMIGCGVIALFFSLLPALQDIRGVSAVGVIISVLLLAATALLIPARLRLRGEE